MTCIIGFADKDMTWMVGDSMGFSSIYNGKSRRSAKVFKVKDKPIVIGYTTSYRMGQLLEFHPEIFPDLHRDKSEYDREYVITRVIPELLKLYKESGWDKKYQHGDREGGTFMIGVKGHIYTVQDDFSMLESLDDYDSCGCGEDFALGSIATSLCGAWNTKDVLRTALGITAKFSPGVDPPFHYVTTDGDLGELKSTTMP